MNCKEDDDAGDLYIGNWLGSKIEATGCNSDGDNFSTNPVCDANSCYSLSINSDGTFSYQQGLDTIAGTWSLSGSELSLCVDEEDELVCVVYQTTLGEVLTLSLTSESSGCTNTITFGRE